MKALVAKTGLLLAPLLDEAAHVFFEVLEETLGSAGALELFTDFLGYVGGGRVCRNAGLGDDGLGLFRLALSLKAAVVGFRVPERGEVVGHDGVAGVGWPNLPVTGKGRDGVRVVQESV